MNFTIGEVLRLKKKHPCGSHEWRVTRVGADIGIQCLGCGRYTLIDRPTLERRVKPLLKRRPD